LQAGKVWGEDDRVHIRHHSGGTKEKQENISRMPGSYDLSHVYKNLLLLRQQRYNVLRWLMVAI
jgi:hypothetical protein